MCPGKKEREWVIEDKKSWPPLWQGSQELPVVKGTSEVIPKEAIAGRLATLRVIVRPDEPIATSGRILLNLPRNLGGRSRFFLPLGFVPVEERPGYGTAVSVKPSKVEVKLALHTMCDVSYAGTWAILEAVVSEGEPKQGDEVTFIIGDPRAALVQLPEHSQRGNFEILIDVKGEGHFRRLGALPSIDIKGDFPVRFLVFAPAVAAAEETFAVSIVAADRVNFNPSALYEGKATLKTFNVQRSTFKRPLFPKR